MPPENRSIKDILSQRDHRPWPMPSGPWSLYQEWHDTIFVHWKIPLTQLLKLIPKGLIPDLFEEEAWVSLVIFTLRKMRPRILPPFPPISDFHEVNVRTYVNLDNKPGIYFLSIEASRFVTSVLARTFSGLPYEFARVDRFGNTDSVGFTAVNSKKQRDLEVQVKLKEGSVEKSALDRWLMERYCLYLERQKKIYRFEVHHLEWPVLPMELASLRMNYNYRDLSLADLPASCAHFSPGVKVMTWWREQVQH